MIAAHRDQENLVHSHQHAPIKQQPKTPGARYPKTPGNFGRNDENAPTALAGKAGLASGAMLGATSILAMGKATGPNQTMVTPMGNRARAPLGNKTTNVKARNAQTGGVKSMVGEIEKTRSKQTSVRKPKKHPADLQPVKFSIQSDFAETPSDEVPEPEYAPPRPTPLPYESDVLPPGGLTFNGIKRENLLKGYYQHFHNPVDENGVSRMEKKFNDEMAALMHQAEERNAREVAAFDWSPEDMADNRKSIIPLTKADIATRKQAPTISARRAASALAVHSDRRSRSALQPVSTTSQATRRPLSSIITGAVPAKPVVTKPNYSGNSTGEAASRTTLGYSRGRSASSIVHMRGASHSAKQQLPLRPAPSHDAEANLTITPARLRQAASGTTEQSRPQFMSIFDDADEELPPVQRPFLHSDDEEEFELKITI